MIIDMSESDQEELTGNEKQLSLVDEALVAGTIANTNGLLVILAKLIAKGVFDRADLQAFSDSYSKPLDHVGMRENELVSQMQDQMEFTLAELMRYLSEREQDE
jgi:hypothetical protein